MHAPPPGRKPSETRTDRRERTRHPPDGPRLHRHPAGYTAPSAASATARATGHRWLTRHPTSLGEDEAAALKDVLARCPELDVAAEHVRGFGEILTHRCGSTLPAWIDAVDASQLPGLTDFALHRIKKIKRRLYGRAGFELLRKMILLE
ncbi:MULTISPECIES: hypothetical protein [unclassified Streptomyces]|uniref:hypothetical protein n=1 Tax=unclassified Streptomyces TaxID=2593676 RepID=UPI0036E5CE21